MVLPPHHLTVRHLLERFAGEHVFRSRHVIRYLIAEAINDIVVVKKRKKCAAAEQSQVSAPET